MNFSSRVLLGKPLGRHDNGCSVDRRQRIDIGRWRYVELILYGEARVVRVSQDEILEGNRQLVKMD